MNRKPFFGGAKKQNQNGNVDDLISEEMEQKEQYQQEGGPAAARKPNLGSKPRFAMKPGLKAAGPPMQTPQKLYDNRNGSEAGGQEMLDMDNGVSPPQVNMYTGQQNDTSKTPPPHPNSRVQGAKQFSKPMKITKKKFNMGGPADGNQWAGLDKPVATPSDRNQYLQTPTREDSADRGLNHSASKTSAGLHREGSAQRIVPDSQLGPQIMKKKVLDGSAYQNSPFRGGGPRPPSNARMNRSGMNSAMKNGPNAPSGPRGAYGGAEQPSMTDGNYSDGEFESVNPTHGDEDDGMDPMDRMRAAMAKENENARSQQNRNQQQQRTNDRNEKLFQQPQSNLNPLSQQKNHGGFAKSKGLVIGERIDHSAKENQEMRSKELKSLISLSQQETFVMFEMNPQSKLDCYFKDLSAGIIMTQAQSTKDDNVDQETQTEDYGANHKFNQAPDDMVINYNRDKNTYVRKKKRDNEALNLEKFVNKAGPVIEKLVEENTEIAFLNNRGAAAKRNAVELKQSLKFPEEILYLFLDKQTNQPAQIIKVSAINMFESSPQSKVSIAYTLQKGDGELVYLAIVFSITSNKHSAILQCEQEITQMCTPGNSDILILSTVIGSLYLYDLKNITANSNQSKYNYTALLEKSNPRFSELAPEEQQRNIQSAMMRYSIQTFTFQTDGLIDFPHNAPIKQLVFISRAASGMAQIGCLDVFGIVSVWSIIEVKNAVGDYDLNISIGGKFKMVMNYTDNLFGNSQLMDGGPGILNLGGASADPFDSAVQTMEIEFDPTDSFIFFFSTSNAGLFKVDKKEKNSDPIKMDTLGMNSPTALSMSDRGYLLAAYSCGSICLYKKEFTIPMTVWYQQCPSPITQIKWCLLYFEDTKDAAAPVKDEDKALEIMHSTDGTNFSARICEFFAIDQNENFQIWNLQKSTTKPAHTIHFREKHQSDDENKIYKISTTCPDQSFFTAFALKDFSVSMYLMNFKKGSAITKSKLQLENKKSMKIIKNLPSNLMSHAQLDIEIQEMFAAANLEDSAQGK